MDVGSTGTTRPLFVDLDGTLIATDLLWETLFRALRQDLTVALKLPVWLARGKAHLKEKLAGAGFVDPATLPYRQDVVARIEEARAEGRRVVLATGAHESLARAIADHLGLFDAVMASDGADSLTGARKLARIRDSGRADTGFDYLGNSHEDMALFGAAEEATVVAPDRSAARWKRRTGARCLSPRSGATEARAALRALRPHQWMKNLLIFVPPVVSLQFLNAVTMMEAALGFASFCLAASSIYIVNDLLDLEEDRRHRTKRNRPFASGALSIATGLKLSMVCFVGAALVATALPPAFALALVLYMATTSAYSLMLKRMLLIDVLGLAALYTLRVLAGNGATSIAPSFWLLAFSLFFFMSLALVKRYTELREVGTAACRSVTGRGYVEADLETLSQAGMASGFAAAMVLALYINSAEIRETYSMPFVIWPLCPLVLYIIVRIWVLARRQEMHDDPVVFIMQDWRSQLMIGTGALLLLGAAYA